MRKKQTMKLLVKQSMQTWKKIIRIFSNTSASPSPPPNHWAKPIYQQTKSTTQKLTPLSIEALTCSRRTWCACWACPGSCGVWTIAGPSSPASPAAWRGHPGGAGLGPVGLNRNDPQGWIEPSQMENNETQPVQGATVGTGEILWGATGANWIFKM